MFENIPAELRALPQWVVWRAEQREDDPKPTKRPYQGRFPSYGASVVLVDHHTSFETCVDAVRNGLANGIGYVFRKDDPYTGIDLDSVFDRSDAWKNEVQSRVIEKIGRNGYVEWSPSGQGVHIIVKAKADRPGKFKDVEVYSSERFFTFTGNVHEYSGSIQDQSDNVRELVRQIHKHRESSGRSSGSISNGWKEQRRPDHEVMAALMSNVRWPQIKDLSNLVPGLSGDDGQDYDDASSGDQALMNYIVAETAFVPQMERIFATSMRPTRPKWQIAGAYKNKMRRVIRSSLNRTVPEEDLAAMDHWVKAQVEEATAARIEREAVEASERAAEVKAMAQAGIDAMATSDVPPLPPYDDADPYVLPPNGGLLADIAHYVYATAQAPDRHIALAAALAFMCGTAGSAFNIMGGGLNMYLLLTARTGIGKDAITKGLSRLRASIVRDIPAVDQFVGKNLASGPGFLRQLQKKPCLYVLVDEIGDILDRMSTDSKDNSMKSLRKELLELYTLSGRHGRYEGMAYSDKEKNLDAVERPAVTILGYGTPGTVFSAIDRRMMEQGFLPRFFVIECPSMMPTDPFETKNAMPEPWLCERIASFVTRCLLGLRDNVTDIDMDAQAAAMDADIFALCKRKQGEAGDDEALRSVWTRVRHNVLKLAAIACIGREFNAPVPTVTGPDYQWGLALEMHSTRLALAKMKEGGLGVGADGEGSGTAQLACVARILVDYWERPARELGDVNEAMHGHKIIGWSYLMRRVQRLTAFNAKSRQGRSLSRILQDTLQDMEGMKLIVETPTHDQAFIEAYGGNGKAKAYRFTDVEALQKLLA